MVLFILVRKPMKHGMASRQEGIQKELDELEQKKEAAKRELALFEGRIAGMKEQREAIVKDFQKEGEREKQKIIDGARKTAARIVEQAQLTVQQEIQKANQNLREEVAEMSVKMAEDLLRKQDPARERQREQHEARRDQTEQEPLEREQRRQRIGAGVGEAPVQALQ